MRSRQDTTFRPSRRAFLSGQVPESTAHIVSLIVQARPEEMPVIQLHLDNMKGIEVHATGDNGRMVVTAEALSDSQLIAQIGDIESTKGVILVSLVYHQIEDAADDDA